MKKCKKCNNEYKETYNYCPKCGKPYNNSTKPAKIPSLHSNMNKLTYIIDVFLYIIGVLIALTSLLSMYNEPAVIPAVLFGISLFPIVYKIIEEQTLIEPLYIKLARFVIPLFLLFCMGIVASPVEEEPSINQNNNINQSEKIDNTNHERITKVEKNEEKNTTNNKQTNNTNKNANNANIYIDALRKCTVMEGADIYTTGIGRKSDNVFNDGRQRCENLYQQLGENEFINAATYDWNNRQNEQIEGKPLSHYLEVLGW